MEHLSRFFWLFSTFITFIFFAWSFIGTPLGIVFTVRYLVTKDKKQKQKHARFIKIGFAGILGLITWFSLTAFLNALGILSDPFIQYR